MIERFGVILIDDFELILRVYETTQKDWRLIYYFSKNFTGIPATQIFDAASTTIAMLFSDQYTQHIAEWKFCTRSAPNNLIEDITALTGLKAEYLTQQREQELLCKGMFTELW
jgi:hypothetical protein